MNKHNLRTEPWLKPVETRLKKMLNSNMKNIVYISEVVDVSTTRYRIYNMCQSLDFSDEWSGTYFIRTEIDLLINYLNRVDVLVVVRVQWSLNFENLIIKAKQYGVKIVYDIDDLVFDYNKIPLLMNTLNIDFNENEQINYWFSYIARIKLMMNKCDYIICTNNYLKEKLHNILNKKIFSINNFLNNEQIIFSNKICKQKTRHNKNKFIIGYFSGTPSHINDLRVALLSIAELMYKYDDIYLEVVGFMEFPHSVDKLIEKGRIYQTAFVDFLTLQQKISDVDLNIIPLVNNEFTNCKSELKFFEASIVNTISCATPTYVYKKYIRDGKTGFLCNDWEWFETIENIYKNRKNNIIKDKAKKFCLDKYSPKNQCKNIERVLNLVNN